MKKFPAVFLIVGGLLTILLAIAYMLVFFDLPYPDATLEENIQENFHMRITYVIVGVGFLGFWVGLLGGMAQFLFRIFKKRK